MVESFLRDDSGKKVALFYEYEHCGIKVEKKGEGKPVWSAWNPFFSKMAESSWVAPLTFAALLISFAVVLPIIGMGFGWTPVIAAGIPILLASGFVFTNQVANFRQRENSILISLIPDDLADVLSNDPNDPFLKKVLLLDGKYVMYSSLIRKMASMWKDFSRLPSSVRDDFQSPLLAMVTDFESTYEASDYAFTKLEELENLAVPLFQDLETIEEVAKIQNQERNKALIDAKFDRALTVAKNELEIRELGISPI